MDRSRIRYCFADAISLPPERRAPFIQASLDGDAAAIAEVLSLIEANDRAGDYLASTPFRTTSGRSESPATTSPNEGVGAQFDGYTLQKVLGEGGFGLVYMAEQTIPLRRWVAVKILKAGVDTAAVMARFEAERQVLAMMEHPHIARVYGAGVSPAGRPYFVMELVRGVSITKFCDEHHLPVRDRLALFMQVCRAVQHAHQKGIIHRDLKPGNVLVAMGEDGKPDSKIIDFGIAKAVSGRSPDASLLTVGYQVMGTPVYMSPEQADPSGNDIDTRADVYALGVMLYELLTGTPPFDPATLHAAGFAEIQRIIREVDPPAPSTRVGTLGQKLTGVADDRAVHPPRLHRLLRGELDWIVMHALEKERQRRYDSAAAFAEDIERFLRDDPVRAGPPSASYRARKFVSRNRVLVATGAAIFLSLLLGLGLATAGFLQARHDRDEKQKAFEKAAREEATAKLALKEEAAQRAAADRNADRAKRLVDFGDILIGAANPDITLSSNTTAREMLDRAAAKLDGFFAGHPEAEMQMRARLGIAYFSLGDDYQALPLLTRAVELMRSQPDTPLWDQFWYTYAYSYNASAESVDWFQSSLEARDLGERLVTQRQPELGKVLALARTAVGRGGARYDRAVCDPLIIDAFNHVERVVPNTEQDRMPALLCLWHIAAAIQATDPEAGLIFHGKVLALSRETFPESSIIVFSTRAAVIDNHFRLKHFDEAAAESQRMIDAVASSRRADSALVATARGRHAVALGRIGRTADAIAELEEVVPLSIAHRGLASNDVFWQLASLLEFKEGDQRLAANQTLRQQLAVSGSSSHVNCDSPVFLRAFGAEYGDFAQAVTSLEALWEKPAPSADGRDRELVDRIIAARKSIAPTDAIRDHFLGRWLTYRISVWGNRGAPNDLLLKLNETALDAMMLHDADDTNCYGWALLWNAMLHLRLNDPVKAESSALASTARFLSRGIAEKQLARSLLRQGRAAEAFPIAQAALLHNTERFDVDHFETRDALATLLEISEALGRLPEVRQTLAAQLLDDALAPSVGPIAFNHRAWLMVQIPGAAPEQAQLAVRVARRVVLPEDVGRNRTLGVALLRAGEYAEAIQTLQHADGLLQSARKSRFPSILAYLAIAHHRLGHAEEARTALDLARAQLATPEFAGDPIATRAIEEATATLLPAAP